jgi:sRNA-binding carbon storage regulator CsrA
VLIHRRKEGEALLIGDSIEIRIIRVRTKVVLGVIAPRDVPVSVRTVSQAAMENTVAACEAAHITRMKGLSAGAEAVVLSLGLVRGKSRRKADENTR